MAGLYTIVFLRAILEDNDLRALFFTDNSTFDSGTLHIGSTDGDRVVINEEQNIIQIDLRAGFCVNQAVHNDV